jgi:prepilin-type N-terminal cleavage/methylation domain-containing protein/prepilin-type processing-associated H-X9-DG protein
VRSWACRRRRGFTLVELLVAIGVIALLVAVTNPMLQGAMERARSAGCVAHLRQIYSGLQAYGADKDQHLPIMLPMRASLQDSGPTLDTALAPYISDPSVFHCPADSVLFAQSGCSYLWDYGYSVNAQGQQNDSMISPSFPLLQGSNLSDIPFVSDKESFHKIAPGAHILYGDGHVQ